MVSQVLVTVNFSFAPNRAEDQAARGRVRERLAHPAGVSPPRQPFGEGRWTLVHRFKGSILRRTSGWRSSPGVKTAGKG